MYADNTLTPKEAVRLCALGTLALGPMRYSALVSSIRSFVSHMLGPSLDVMGPAIELLKYEGLIEPQGGIGMEDDAEFTVTDTGRDELRALLTANIRNSAMELNDLIIALKFRFLHLLDAADQRDQAELLMEACENELARLEDLRDRHSRDSGFLVRWLDHDIKQLEERLDWLTAFRDAL